jgi:lipopolysaccharide export system permease protein
MVFFIDKLKNNSDESTSVFVSKMEDEIETITTAKTGKIETIDGDRFLALAYGQQTVIDHRDGHIRMTDFNQFKYKIDPSKQNILNDVQSQMLSTFDLIVNRSPFNLGELFWRLGLFIAALNMTLLAVQLASVNPRVGRSYSLALAILCFVGYFNAITIGKRMIANQTFGFGESMLVVHGTATICVLIWYLHTEYNLHWRRLLPSPSI